MHIISKQYLFFSPQLTPESWWNDRGKMVKLTRQLDEEVQKRDQVSAESQQLERRLQDGRNADWRSNGRDERWGEFRHSWG